MKSLRSPEQEIWLTQGELANKLGVTTHTLQDWRHAGRGPRYIDMGGRAVRYCWSDVQTWLASLPSRSDKAPGMEAA